MLSVLERRPTRRTGAVYFLAFCCFVGLGGASPFKTLVSAGMGFSLAAVGMDTISGSLRLTYGLPDLVKGVSFLVAVIGLFGIGELIATMEDRLEFRGARARLTARRPEDDRGTPLVLDRAGPIERRRVLDGHHPRRTDGCVVHEEG